MPRKGWVTSHPLTGTCLICDEALGSVPLLKRPAGWVHKACWMTEKGE